MKFRRGKLRRWTVAPALTLVCLLWPDVVFSQSDQRQLKDIFNLQWLASTRGRPEQVSERQAGQLSLTAATPFFMTTNPQSIPGGGSADMYFGPWVTAEWKKPLDRDTNWYLGASFADYQYIRFPELNSAFAEVSAGITTTLARSDWLSVSGYAVAACDYNMNSAFASDDWEASLSLGLTIDLDLGCGHSLYFTPDATGLQAFPERASSNSFLSLTPTAGWTWQVTNTVTVGAYWSGGINYYPTIGQSDFLQYIGANADWQATPNLSIGLSCIETLSSSTNAGSRYADLSAGITVKFAIPGL
ncbi:hypothetical protein TSACC_21176 [Terrimicrobium sacchariphilum]|uniref:MetA-pathway of phenol degradation n=1 Tax=Terrimicrobium sacchariphilum TaxID=690879 RepID=A0A146G785_TERSA|nr:hypothetical protein [Terrimicrobium sacchariphilum]GAT32774.1 hypothetical protein TSACC_21176 [Terrimicrobium sacchariphilum]